MEKIKRIVIEPDDKTLITLAGNPFGRYMYKRLCSGIDFSSEEKIVFEIPERIELITAAFIQGFFDEIKSNLGMEGIIKKIDIISDNPTINLRSLLTQLEEP